MTSRDIRTKPVQDFFLIIRCRIMIDLSRKCWNSNFTASASMKRHSRWTQFGRKSNLLYFLHFIMLSCEIRLHIWKVQVFKQELVWGSRFAAVQRLLKIMQICHVRPGIGHCFLAHHCLAMLYESPVDGQPTARCIIWPADHPLLSRVAIKNSRPPIFYTQKNALIMTAVLITIHILFMEVNVCQKK